MKVQKHIKKIKKALGTKSTLDFEHKCVFRNQLSYNGMDDNLFENMNRSDVIIKEILAMPETERKALIKNSQN